ncbi:putative ribonuclease H-like domain-containing protein [Tanacetum coccineum]
MELMEKRRKHFAALRAQEKRNRPPTKKKDAWKKKRAVKEQQKESLKKLKVEEEKESEEVEEGDEVELKKLLVIKKDEDISIDAIPQICQMLQGIDREDLEALWRIMKGKYGDTRPEDEFERGNPQYALQDQGIFDSGCSRHMTGSKSYLTDYQDIDGGFVAFAGKKSVLFTETGCLVLSHDFKLLDESQILLKVPRQNNMYSFDLKNVVPSGGLTFLFAKATIDESNLWHRRIGHINFKTMNKLVRGNLVRGLPSKIFENDHTCVACQKGKQHRASCKTKLVSYISHPSQMLHTDLFRLKFVRSINHKIYCLVVTDDYSRFSWVFFLATKDETSRILKTFITGIENQINHKVKIIRCDNGTEFKNNDMNQFCGMKGIKRDFSVARTPQQNGVAERKNRTLIEAARTMLIEKLHFLP